jgi:hypothetical protein
MQDRFMVTFWLKYPVRNDLQHTRIIGRRAFNALPADTKDNQNFLGRACSRGRIQSSYSSSAAICWAACSAARPW